MRWGSVWALALLLLAASAGALEVPPAPQGRVSDFAGLLAPADRQRLESRLEQIEAASSNQFAVALFKSLEGDSLEDFSIRLGDAWKVGHKGRDNGLLLLLFVDDRKVRIEVGKGLEGAIPDALAGRVIRDVMRPRFREGDYAGGLLAAAEALDAASRGEFQPLPEKVRGVSVPAPLAGLLPFLLFGAFWLLAARLNRAQHLGHRGYRDRTWWVGPWGGFGSGGGFGGGFGGGGGGFSGGGGGFGGGGASGDW